MFRPSLITVFPWEPTWDNPISETYDWKTKINTTLSLVEQRIATRVFPRLTLEFTILEWGNESARIEAFVRQTGTLTFYVPFWPDAAVVDKPIPAGSTSLPLTTLGQNFFLTDGDVLGLVMVFQDTDNYDVCTVTAIQDGGLTVATGPAFNVPAGAKVVPLVLMRFSQNPQATITSAHVKQGTFQFESVQPVRLASTCTRAMCDAFLGTQFNHDNRPVILTPPDDAAAPTVTFDRVTVELDSQTGLTRVLDVSGRSTRKQVYRATTFNVGETGALRYFLFNLLRGRQGAVFVPTFSKDLYLTQDIYDNNLHVQNVSYSINGGPAMGIDRVMLFHYDGNYTMENIVNCQQNDPFTETLAMRAAYSIPQSAISMISWVALMRSSSDSITIKHTKPGGSYAVCDITFVNTHNDGAGFV